MTDISVIIVSWNTRELLLECIRTVLQTTLEHRLEIIVVDNGSTDGSAAAAKELPNVTVVCNGMNVGFAVASNMGICACSGKYICLVNSDVKVLETCLDRMCKYMDEQPEVGLLGPRILNGDLTLQVSCAELPSIRNTVAQALMLDKVFPCNSRCRARFMKDFDPEVVRNVEVLSGCLMMARREALDEVGLLDERFFIYKEDVDWCKRFGDAGWQIRFFPMARAIHYGGASSSVAPAAFLIEMEKANLQYWRKHHSWLGQKTATLASLAHYWLRVCGWALVYLVRPGNDIIAKQIVMRYATCLRWLVGVACRGDGEYLVR